MSGELYCPSCEHSFYTDEPQCPRDGARLVRLDAPDPLIGRELDGRYTILERLGHGGMGVVYRAKQHSVDREVAIKVVHANLVSDPEVIKRFLREAKLASQLGHPNTVAVLDFGKTDDGVFYLVMERIAGRTLDVVFHDEGVFDARRLVRIGVQICDALEAARAMSIVHRDLKPANIILLDNSRDLVKVLDFGLAKSLESGVSQLTAGVCGTPAFLAPERACGGACDPRSDLYSLGCILYVLGSGMLPFWSSSVPELMRMQVTDPAPPMRGVPVVLAEIIDRLLAKDPAQRYQTAGELRDALEEALPVTGQTSTPPRRPTTAPGANDTLDSVPARPLRERTRPLTVEEVHELVRSETVAAPVEAPAVVPAVAAGDASMPGPADASALAARAESPGPRAWLALVERHRRAWLALAERRRRPWLAGALAVAAAGVLALRSSEPASSPRAHVPAAASVVPPAEAIVEPLHTEPARPIAAPARPHAHAQVVAKLAAKSAGPTVIGKVAAKPAGPAVIARIAAKVAAPAAPTVVVKLAGPTVVANVAAKRAGPMVVSNVAAKRASSTIAATLANAAIAATLASAPVSSPPPVSVPPPAPRPAPRLPF